MSRPRPRRTAAPIAEAVAEPAGLLGDAEPSAAALGEFLRRVALGLAAALVVARAYWYCEGNDEVESGTGLAWAMAMVGAAALASISWWLGGGIRLRRSWADLAVVALFALVALSARWADEKRIAINRAWEWAAVGLAYLLVRNLPRTRGESSALAGVMVATAVALSAYGLVQVRVELPLARAEYRGQQNRVLKQAGVDPNNAQSVRRFEDRLLGSREPTATFALANTLAGFLVGPAAVGLALALRNLRRSDPPTSRALPLLLGALPLASILGCLLLTKSRSAYVGLFVALLAFGWRERGRVSGRALALGASGLVLALAGLVVAATLTGQLDRQVLTESSKSLGYRLEYWRGAWGVIGDRPRAFWWGWGPGNFAGPYLRHKLPQASEEIVDPHNLFLEVWATAGLPALLALVAALGWGLREALGPSRPTADAVSEPGEPPAPRSSTWLVVAAGLGGWLLVVALGRINPFEDDRWLILGVAWGLAAGLGRPLWVRLPIGGDLPGLGVVAILVNLLAAGGIGFAPVALMLWCGLALALNLRDDRPCGRPRRVGGRGLAFVPPALVAALLGTFLGTVVPFWKAEAAIAEGDARVAGKVPDFEAAQKSYAEANRADQYGARGWVARARLRYTEWLAQGRPPDLLAWSQINSALEKGATRPRNPMALAIQRMRAGMAREFLAQPELDATMKHTIRIDRRDACVRAMALYPSSAAIRADYAQILGDLNQPAQAADHAEIALELDRRMPHADKKLDGESRKALERDLFRWKDEAKKAAEKAPSPPASPPKKPEQTPQIDAKK